jgi:hypothetical protein
MEGFGEYRLPSGVLYRGHMKNGVFHGDGKLIFPDAGIYTAVWDNGVAKSGKYTFADGLSFKLEGWQYATLADRRYYDEIVKGEIPPSKVAPDPLNPIDPNTIPYYGAPEEDNSKPGIQCK